MVTAGFAKLVEQLIVQRFDAVGDGSKGGISGTCLSIANVSSAGLSSRAVNSVCNSSICLSSCDFSVLAARVPASCACCSCCRTTA